MRLIKVTRGGVGVKYTDAKGNARHALKTAEDKPFECDDAQAERLVGLGVAEYVNDLGWKEENNEPQNDGEDDKGDDQNKDGEEGTAAEPGRFSDKEQALMKYAEELNAMDYNDVKAIAADMGVTPEGKKKVDYINAIIAEKVKAETDEDDEDGLPTLSAADPE